LQQATGEAVQWVNTVRGAIGVAREQEISAVVLDESILDLEPSRGEGLLQHFGTATPVHVNLAVCGKERLIREVRHAMQRRQREEQLARQAVEAKLRSELNGPLTALLLSCELLLKEERDLPPAAAAKLTTIREMASEMRQQLGKEMELQPH
jgi:signal transduction histidine kinase